MSSATPRRPTEAELNSSASVKWALWRDDSLLILVMAVLAGCGLIYEYLLSHYAGRVLGSLESTIFAMIGTMIVAMGIGAFAARFCKDAISAFAWLEVLIALLGMAGILGIAGLIALSYQIPQLLSATYNLPADASLNGYPFNQLQQLTKFSPYLLGLALGIFIGMEIPLIARVRQSLYQHHLENNAGTIYGADYLGAGVGAAVWVSIMLSLPIMQAAAWTALFNLVAGAAFLLRFYRQIRWRRALLLCHGLLLALLLMIYSVGQNWLSDLSNVLYKDQVIYSHTSHYQQIVLTERFTAGKAEPTTDLFLNGRLQFSSSDEQMYHELLVRPALLASNNPKRVLIIGGGDGLALRNVLAWPGIEHVVLVDLDPALVQLFGYQPSAASGLSPIAADPALQQRLLTLNKQSFRDPRAEVRFNDAFIEVDQLLAEQQQFDSIIVDLPDPNHPDLTKLYSDYFYDHLRQLLSPDGAMTVQSTSPYHAHKAFLSIAKTIKAAGFSHVEQYQHNIPSFGQWGFSIACKQGRPASARIAELPPTTIPQGWLSQRYLLAQFVFADDFFNDIESIKINALGTGTLYDYYKDAWQQESDLYKN